MNNTTAFIGNMSAPRQPYLSSSLRAGLTFVYVITLLVALLGNAVSLLIVYRRRSFRNTMNLLIANMCIADMLVVLFVIPFALSYFHREGRWIEGVGGDVACRISRYASVVSIAASILTILFISSERFVAICYPLKGRLLRMPKVMTSLIWVIALAVMSPYLVIYKNIQSPSSGNWYCTEDFGDQADMPQYMVIHFLILFILLYAFPLLVISVLNSAIVWRLARHRMPGEDHGRVTQSQSRDQAVRNRRKAVKMLIMLMFVFAVCWLPTHLMHLFATVRRDILYSLPIFVPHLFFWFGYLNSALNPCIYVLFSANFRRDLKLIFVHSQSKKSQVTVKMTMSDGSRDRSGSGLGRFVRRWGENWSMKSSIKSSRSNTSPGPTATHTPGFSGCMQLEPILRGEDGSSD